MRGGFKDGETERAVLPALSAHPGRQRSVEVEAELQQLQAVVSVLPQPAGETRIEEIDSGGSTGQRCRTPRLKHNGGQRRGHVLEAILARSCLAHEHLALQR